MIVIKIIPNVNIIHKYDILNEIFVLVFILILLIGMINENESDQKKKKCVRFNENITYFEKNHDNLKVMISLF